jgi:hypothetical protein
MTTLVPCPSCDRHVKLGAGSVCPFCSSDLAERAREPNAAPAGGARRAALLAVSAALASTAFIACGDDSPTGGSSTGGANAGGQAQGGQAQGGQAQGGNGTGGEVAMGGSGGQEPSGGAGGDGTGGDGTGGNIAPPYGAPPV